MNEKKPRVFALGFLLSWQRAKIGRLVKVRTVSHTAPFLTTAAFTEMWRLRRWEGKIHPYRMT